MLPSLSKVCHESPGSTARYEQARAAKVSIVTDWSGKSLENLQSGFYPSPPMSGSPPPYLPQPGRGRLEFSDYQQPPPLHHDRLSLGHDPALQAYHAHQDAHQAALDKARAPYLRAYQPEPYGPANSYPYFGMIPTATLNPVAPQYPPLPPQRPPSQQLYSQHLHLDAIRSPSTLHPVDRPADATSEVSAFSPNKHRKSKGHVASACVPCKRAHLRCDAQRPCSRCVSNGKEDSCIDVQHKKRGRPRLRDDRDTARPEASLNANGGAAPDSARGNGRRPMSMFGANDLQLSTSFGNLSRSHSYRVQKSSAQSPYSARFADHAHSLEIYANQLPLAPRAQSRHEHQEAACAYLTVNLQLVKATPRFTELSGIATDLAPKLVDTVTGSDRDKIVRLEKYFEKERQNREPNYLPPIYLRYEDDRFIQSMEYNPGDLAQHMLNQQEILTFQAADGRQLTQSARFGMMKRDSTYVVVMVLDTGSSQPGSISSISPISDEMHRQSMAEQREFPQEYPHTQSLYHPATPSMMSQPSYGAVEDKHERAAEMPSYGNPLQANMYGLQPLSPSSLPFGTSPGRRQHSFSHTMPMMPNQSEFGMLPRQGPMQLPHEVQLPPIRDNQVVRSSHGGKHDAHDNRATAECLQSPISLAGPASASSQDIMSASTGAL